MVYDEKMRRLLDEAFGESKTRLVDELLHSETSSATTPQQRISRERLGEQIP